MSYINLLSNDLWSEADIVNRGRAEIEALVPAARQSELQTIMLGHISGMRVATPEEMQEIGMVQAVTEATSLANAQARADMALLVEVLDFEADPADKVLSPDAQALWDLRHPYVEPVPEPMPEPQPEPTPEPAPEPAPEEPQP
jgi:hypothetical protein